MDLPSKDAFGNRMTVNSALTQDEAVWHFRSGWNVAALNCTQAQYQPVLDTYAAMLRSEASDLQGVNNRLEARFRSEAGGDRRAAIRLRETHSTEVYNYFALPAARREFCNVALSLSEAYATTPPEDFATFAVAGLAQYEAAFERFYAAYEAYETDSAAWDARYGSEYGPSQPGWVALYGTPAQQLAAGVQNFNMTPVETVAVPDTETGAEIPVIPVDDSGASTPVVQPIPGEEIVLPPAEDDEQTAQ